MEYTSDPTLKLVATIHRKGKTIIKPHTERMIYAAVLLNLFLDFIGLS